jgi:ketosteroid isomerase-like protein
MVEVQEHVIELRDMRIRMFGKIAVVSYHVHVKKTTDGRLAESDHTDTDVFEKRAGRWQLVVE